jgi:hypothetical protein
MKELNKKFMKKPETFLGEYLLAESQTLKNAKLSPGVYDFDLQPGGGLIVYLVAPAAKSDEDLITAYWLPWTTGETEEITFGKVDNDGNPIGYFFTSDLGGCRVEIIPPPSSHGLAGSKFKILHIAGDSGGNKGAGPEGSEWRKGQAEENLTKEERQRSRAFSSTAEFPLGYKEEGQTESDAVVVGFRKNYRWRFWAQQLTEAGKLVAWPLLK